MTRRSTLQVLVLIAITCLWSTEEVVSKQTCDRRDLRVLNEIKEEFNSPSLREEWDRRKDCCHWKFVSCSLRKSNRVGFLTFNSEDFVLPRPTPIPPSLAKLPYLQQLHILNLTNITATIPPSFAHLRSLEYLAITGTKLSGPIPQVLTQFNTLFGLDLSDNHLSGPVPAFLPRLKTIKQINLEGNRLSGPFPESFGTVSTLDELYLSHNKLSGEIPASFAKFNLTNLDLSWNTLEGDASVLFGSNKGTSQLWLSGNNFAFDIGKVELPRELWKFGIDHNSIYGTLPQELAQLPFLDVLNVSHNHLCGPIPQGGNLNKFDSSSYDHNKCLCGHPLPPCRS